MAANKRFVILSGPSGMGKGPLQEAVGKFYPDLLAARPILCHSRVPGASDVHGKTFYFLPPSLIKSLQSNSDFVVSQVRSDWQAIDLLQVEDLLKSSDLVFAEVFHTFGPDLQCAAASRGFETLSVFMLPAPLNTPAEEIVALMDRKLRVRGRDRSEKIKERAEYAPVEMFDASKYTHRLLNLATEDDIEEWGEFGMCEGKRGERRIEFIDQLGPNAKWLVETFVGIIQGDIEAGDFSRGNA